jgi:hypothetical protein
MAFPKIPVCNRSRRARMEDNDLIYRKYKFFWVQLLLAVLIFHAPVLHGITYLSKDEALAVAFKDPSVAKRHILVIDDAHRAEIEKELGEKFTGRKIDSYSGELKSRGYGVVFFDSVIGKHELIDYMLVLDKEAKIQFVEILAYRESYGGEIRSESWREQFKEKSPNHLPEHPKNVINISGATLSSRHVTEGVRRLLLIAKAYSKKLGLSVE